VPLVFHLIFHTHWDREWYLPEPALRVRLAGMLDDVLERLDRLSEPSAFLLDGQTILVEDYLTARPERSAVLREAVRSGRLQVGPWYVLADEQIPSGESLVRNLLAGRADAERYGGRLDVLYSPDAFGHPAMLPDLANEFGIDVGALWRGLGDTGGDLIRWRGPAGGALLLYHLPPEGYEVGAALPAESSALARRWATLRQALVSRASSRHVAVFVGADHHRLHPAAGQLARGIAALEPEHEVRISRLDEFLRAAQAETGDVPECSGELRWSYGYAWTLQGTHGTRAPLKRRISTLEARMERIVEPLVALARANELVPLLDRAWRSLLANQFHDTICGTTVDSVAIAAEARCADVDALANELTRRALHRLVRHDPDRARAGARVDPRLLLWNPAARSRDGVVLADVSWFRRDVLVGPGGRVPRSGSGARGFSLLAEDGRPIPVQVLGWARCDERLDADRHYPDQDEVDLVRVAFEPGAVRGLATRGLATTSRRAVPGAREGVSVRGATLANERLSVRVERGGALTLTDRVTGEKYRGVLRLESELDAGDTYSWAPAAGDRRRSSNGRVRLRRLATGPLAGVLDVRWSFAAGRHPSGTGVGSIGLRLVLRLHRRSSLLHCTLHLDNGAIDHRLRLRLPLGVAGETLVTGTGFGVARRPPGAPASGAFPAEQPVATLPAHRFAAAASGDRGLALLTPGFCELEWTETGDLLFTALRAVGQLSRGDLPTRPGHAGWPEPTPLAQNLGRDRIELALAPVSATDLEHPARLHARWEDAFLPVATRWLRDAVPPLDSSGLAELDSDRLIVSAIKPAADGEGIVLRCYNPETVGIAAGWRFAARLSSAVRVRADEREPRPTSLTDGGHLLPFDAAPGEWVTHLVR
jgi:hypothetical protein